MYWDKLNNKQKQQRVEFLLFLMIPAVWIFGWLGLIVYMIPIGILAAYIIAQENKK